MRVIGRRNILIYASLLTVALILANLTISISISTYDAVNWLIEGGKFENVIMDRNSRTVYTSQVSKAIYLSMKRDSRIQSLKAMVLSLVVICNETVILRGYEEDQARDEYGDHIIAGELKLKGPSALIGSWLARRYNLSVGSLIYIMPVKGGNPLILRVSGIYETGDLRDCEIVTNVRYAQMSSGIPRDAYSIISFKGPSDIISSINRTYSLEIKLPSTRYNIRRVLILDSLERVCKIVDLGNNSVLKVNLPYGLYRVYIQQQKVLMEIYEILLNDNLKVSISRLGNVTLRIIYNESARLSLYYMNGTPIKESSAAKNEKLYWLNPGMYMLRINDELVNIALVTDSIIDLTAKQVSEQYKLIVYVLDNLGEPIGNFNLQVSDERGRIIYFGEGQRSPVEVFLPKGRYRVSASYSNIITSKQVDLNESGVEVELRIPVNLREVSAKVLGEVESLKLVKGLDIPRTTLELLLGITLEYYLILIMILSIFAIMTLFFINKIYWENTGEIREILKKLNYTRWQIISKLLIYNLGITAMALMISYFVAKEIFMLMMKKHILMVLGYNLLHPGTTILIPIAILIALAISVSLVNVAREES